MKLARWLATAALGMGMAVASIALIPQSEARAATAIPSFTGLVVDQAGLLSPQVAAQLDASLRQFQRQYGPQIALLTVPSLEGEPIEAYSIRAAEAWKPGDAKRDDGIIMVIAPQDREMRVEVGQGLEGTIPDIIAGRIIRDVVTPYFKEGRMEEGIVAGLNAIARRLGGALTAPSSLHRGQPRQEQLGIPLYLLLVVFFVLLPMLFGGRRRGGGFWTGVLIGNTMGRRGGWGGGGGGGGFGGGGGGGFSGGGASGSW